MWGLIKVILSYLILSYDKILQQITLPPKILTTNGTLYIHTEYKQLAILFFQFVFGLFDFKLHNNKQGNTLYMCAYICKVVDVLNCH